MTGSTLSGNQAGIGISTTEILEGGGIYGTGSSSSTILNSTFANNQAKEAGGGIASNGTMTVVFSTFSGNSAQNGGGAIKASNNTLTLKGTLLANSPGGNCSLSPGALVSSGDNLSDDGSCAAALSQTGDLNNAPAGLEPAGPRDNGGPTWTIALGASSAALDRIPAPSCANVSGTPVTVDQRGMARPQGSSCDIGAFELLSNLPVIVGFTPSSGPAGVSVTITGTQFTGATGVTFNGLPAVFTTPSNNQITATVPAGASTGPIAVTTPYGTAISPANFTIIPPPAITSFAPASGAPGITVTITGANFNGATQVKFNGVSATFSVGSAAQIIATVPSGATTGPISVSTPGGTANSSANFTITGGPTVSGFSPASGGVGASVTITGTNLNAATRVSFNGVNAAFKINGAKIVATVPVGAATGPITVATPVGSATSPTNFTVIPTPQITGFSPASGPVGTVVTISGDNLTGTTSVTVGDRTASFTLNSPSLITAIVPNGAKSGPISVIGPGGTATSAATFTVTK
jgi:predicted outer membrane repeat protein